MKQRILPILCLFLCCVAVLCALPSRAATPLDPNADASLTLHYQKDGQGFSDLTVGIYRVAEAFPDGSFALIAPYSGYRVSIDGISSQAQWQYVATALYSFLIADGVEPTREGITDASGTVKFENLQTGLYLVREVLAENATGIYQFNQFMVYLPTVQSDGTYLYDIEANPKCIGFTPKTHYSVNKLWVDEQMQADRPGEVTIDIYRDGVLYDTQILSGENNWSYTWYVTGEDHSQWTVSERNVPEHYTVTIQESGGVFSVINTRQSTPPEPPQTGDDFSPLPWVLGMCISGILLIVLGIYSRRRK